jgi:hypothetical protein
MRGLTTFTATIAGFTLAFALPAAAQSPSDTKLTVNAKVSPNKAGTKQRPRGVTLSVSAHWRPPAGIEPPIISHAVVLVSRGGLYNGGKYPSCSKRTLDRGGPRACPRRSIMGRGGGLAMADNVPTRPRIVVVNGGARRAWFYTTLFNPAFVQEPVPLIIQRSGGRWSYRVRIVVPESLQVVAGVPISLRDFNVSAGRDKWLATTSCPRNRRWPFRVTTFYAAGGSSTFTDSIRCRR